ncbi:MAG: hypothetical protein WC523_05835 [Patescibacteria group bacterium]|jgi:hypothetical protein
MKITIIGSSSFCKEMVEYQEKLINLGHEVKLHEHYTARAKGERPDLTKRVETEHAKLKIEHDYIRYHYNEIVKSDAVLVLNFDRKGIKNYIGGNTLMELGFAFVHYKKIFLLNPIPEISYQDEIEAVCPLVINSNLSLIV